MEFFGIFLEDFLEEFFWRNFFWRIFFGEIFLEDFFGRTFWGDFWEDFFWGGILCLHWDDLFVKILSQWKEGRNLDP